VESSVEGGAETVLVTCGAGNAQDLRIALKKKYGNESARAVNLTTRQNYTI
jgi:hypothetical protein